MESVGIVGSRNYPRLEEVREYVRRLSEDTVVITGAAPGVDRVAKAAARELGLRVVVYEADWGNEHLSPHEVARERNTMVVQSSDRLVVFWDGKSKGTKMTIGIAKERGVPFEVIKPEQKDLFL